MRPLSPARRGARRRLKSRFSKGLGEAHMAGNANGMQQSLLRMAREEPELAARLFITALPAAVAGVNGRLDYELVVDELGTYAVSIDEGRATVTAGDGVSANGDADFVLAADAETLARLAAGTSPLRLLLGRRLRIKGKRRRALKLRRLSQDLSMRDIARAGVEPDPNLVYKALPYAIDPVWTDGHRFCLKYEMLEDETGGGGVWYVQVDDGPAAVTSEAPERDP